MGHPLLPTAPATVPAAESTMAGVVGAMGQQHRGMMAAPATAQTAHDAYAMAMLGHLRAAQPSGAIASIEKRARNSPVGLALSSVS